MVFASWLSDQFFGGIGWLLIFAGALHFLAHRYGKANPEIPQEANNALKGGILKAIRWFTKK